MKRLKFALETFLTNSGGGKVSSQVIFQKQEATVRIRNSIMARQIGGKACVPFHQWIHCWALHCDV